MCRQQVRAHVVQCFHVRLHPWAMPLLQCVFTNVQQYCTSLLCSACLVHYCCCAGKAYLAVQVAVGDQVAALCCAMCFGNCLCGADVVELEAPVTRQGGS